jgi:hypothetical protein
LKPLCNTTTLMKSYNRLTSRIVILSPQSLIQNPENRQNLGLQNIEDPAQNFGQDPDIPNPVRSGFTFRTIAPLTPTTRLRGWCTPEALTNQGGRTHQYIDYIVCFNTRDSHHLYKYMILYVFHARKYDLNCTIKLV